MDCRTSLQAVAHPVWPLSGSPDDSRLHHSDSCDRVQICSPHFGYGYAQVIPLDDGLELQILDYELHRDLRYDAPRDSDRLEFEFCLSGPGVGQSYILPYLGLRSLGSRRAGDRVFKVEIFCKQPEHACGLHAAIERLPDEVERSARSILDALCRYLGGSSATATTAAIAQRIFTARASTAPLFTFQHVLSDDLYREVPELYLAFRCPISPAMQRVIEQLLACPYRGPTRRAYLTRKAAELVALRLDAIARPPVSPADLDSVRHAARLLRERLACPPTVAQLARQVCSSRSKLHQSFRTVYGTTPFGYLRGMRLWQAQRLLMTSDLSVEEVAIAVGYTSRSRFASAFRDTYNLNPKPFQLQTRQWMFGNE